jgi:hypothetical protein
MKKGIITALAIGSLGLVLGAQSAMAGRVSVEILGNATYAMGTGDPTPTAALTYPGVGLNLNFHLGPKVALQIGEQYRTRTTSSDADYSSILLSSNLGLKYMFSRGFSLIVGGYYNSPMANALASVGTDMGVSAGIGLTVPLSSSIGLYINPAYHYALGQLTYTGLVSGAAATLTPSEVIASVGLILGGGGSK